MPPIRLAFIGCGIAARKLHWPALAKLGRDFTIPVVCNHTWPKAESFAKLIGGAEVSLDYREVLRRTDIDAVNIVLPVELNWEVTRAALRTGKHVIVEKPLAATRRDARAMVRVAAGTPLTVMVAENFRYRPTFLKLRRMIDDGTLGDLYAVNWDSYTWVDRPDNPYVHTRWRLNHRYPGGFIMDAGVHSVAALRMLAGDFAWVAAQVRTVNRRIGEVDTIQMEFETTGGIMGRHAIHFSATGYRDSRLLLFGTRATVEVVGNTITLHRGDNRPPKSIVVQDSGGYREEFQDFARCIRTGREPVSSVAKAYGDFETVMAALDSARRGRRVRLSVI